MSARTLVGLVPIVLAMQPLALAQIGGSGGSAPAPNYVPLEPNEFMYFNGPTPAEFKRTVGGYLTNDDDFDTVTLAGSTPVMLENVSIYGHAVNLPMAALDIDIVPKAVSTTIDGLAVCTANGVEVWGHDESAAAPYFSKLYTISGIWAGATAVRCRAVAGGGTWFAGIRAGGLDIAVRSPAGVDFSKALSSTAKGIAWLEWDNTTADPELAVLQDDRVTVYEPSAGFSMKYQWSLGTSHAMTVAPAGSHPDDRDVVAVLHTIGGVKQLLYVHSISATAVTIDLPTTVNYKAITSGDATGDGRTDLFVQVGRWYAPLYFEHTATAALPYVAPTNGDFGPLNIDDDPLLSTAIANNAVAAPCVADMNFDGRADILIAMNQSTGTLNQAPMFYLLRSTLNPTLGTYYVNSSSLHYILQSFVSGIVTGNERKLVVRYLAGGTEPPPGNAVEISVWRQTALGVQIDTPPVYRAVHMIDPNAITPYPDYSTGFVCTIYEDSLCDGEEDAPVYWTMVLPVDCVFPDPPTTPQTVNYTHRYSPKWAAMVSTCDDYVPLIPQADKYHSLVQLLPPVGTTWTQAQTCVSVDAESCPPISDRTTPAPVYVGRRRGPTFGTSAQVNSTGQPHNTSASGSTIAY